MLPAVNKNGLVHSPVGPPRIEPVPEGVSRPLWSVMIPTFNCAKYLRQTLDSVLRQDPGEGQMQIEVVDDCSTQDDPEAVVHETGKGRVAFHRKPKNEGAIANFNTCLQRSRGHLVHVLHGDDYVLPGFYARLAEMEKKYPDVAGFFVRCLVVDENGSLDRISGKVQQLAEPSNAPGDLLYVNNLMAPGAVIRRDFYETHGGFMPSLIHVADWEMWTRAVQSGRGLWLNEPLAAYRYFPGNDTGRLARTAENLRDVLRLGAIFAANFDGFDPHRFRVVIARRAQYQKRSFVQAGDKVAAEANDKLWRELTPWPLRWGSCLRSLVLSGSKWNEP